MTTTSTTSLAPINVPNILTMLRIVLTLALCVVYPCGCYIASLVLFVVASLTDFVDGWWARKFGQISVFGRIVDPLADKLLVCSIFIFFVATPSLAAVVPAWMAVVIVGRELLVTSLRAVIENSRGDFSAKWVGKWKMGLQCVAVVAVFLLLITSGATERLTIHWHETFGAVLGVSLWGAVFLTVYSGVDYTIRAVRMIAER
ncbi:MAG: CDP-diacylglycerol--glycerol-3-phosphate 3-phosphatidyltransferase [Thermoguttaceae bacterium]